MSCIFKMNNNKKCIQQVFQDNLCGHHFQLKCSWRTREGYCNNPAIAECSIKLGIQPCGYAYCEQHKHCELHKL